MEEREQEREKGDNGVFDEDGKVQTWFFEAFQQFVSTLSSAGTSQVRTSQVRNGKETNKKHSEQLSSAGTSQVRASQVRNGKETNKKHSEHNNEEVIREEGKEQKISSSKKEKWQQKVSHKEDEEWQQQPSHKEDDMQRAAVSKLISNKGSRKEIMLDILTTVANQGESILEDESFVDYCSTVLCNGEDSNGVSQHMSKDKNKIVSFLGKEKSDEHAGKDKSKKGMEGTNSLFKPKDKETTDGPLDKDQMAVHEGTLVNKVAFSDFTVDNTVHDGSFSAIAQPTPTFAEIIGKKSTHTQPTHFIHNSGNLPSSPLSSNDCSTLFKIQPDILAKRMKLCNHSIVGRISLSKGDEPWSLKKLRDKLESIWGLRSSWRLISLGRGYYHILLLSKEEWDKVWARGPLYLKPGVLRLQRWSINFDPAKQKTSHAQVWFRIYHLPWGLWDPSIIAGIAGKVGTPLKFDKATVEGDFGHYARVLVDVDLSKRILSNIHVECANVMIEVKIMPENIPSFCRGCNSIGHSMTECRSLIKQEVKTKSFNGERGGEPDLQIAANSGNSSLPFAGPSKTTDDIQKLPSVSEKAIENDCHAEHATQIIEMPAKDKGQLEEVNEDYFKGSKQKSSEQSQMVIQKDNPKGGASKTATGDQSEKANGNLSSIILHNKFGVLEEDKQQAEGEIEKKDANYFPKFRSATQLRKEKWGDIFMNDEDVPSKEDQPTASRKSENSKRPLRRAQHSQSQ